MGSIQRANGMKGGRPVGSKSQKTLEWEAIKQAMINRHIPKMNKLLDRLWEGDDEEQERAMKHTMNLLEYFAPKMARTEHTIGGADNTVTAVKIEIINAPLPPAQGADTAD